jgi:hypothetical protein
MGVIRLLSGILLVISIIGLSACGDKNSDTYTLDDINSREVLSEEKYPEDSGSELEPEPKKEPPSDPANNSDEVLKTMEIPLKNGEALTLSVIGKKKDDIELYGVREINVYKKENCFINTNPGSYSYRWCGRN